MSEKAWVTPVVGWWRGLQFGCTTRAVVMVALEAELLILIYWFVT